MEVEEDVSNLSNGGISKSMGVMACTGMTVLYVATLYSPTLILRLPHPTSYKQFLIRRFFCAFFSSLLSLFLSSLILIPRSWKFSHLLAIYGIRDGHIWLAVVFPFSLTSLMYAGSLAPITEELVFRACMIPLLLCGGFKPQTVVFLCPVFFSLGTQLAYTVVFGSYASFLFIRTGHLIAPLVAHIVCNFMGLPAVYSGRKGALVSLAFIAGTIGYLRLLFPLTKPALYNSRTDSCHCWHGYCSWT